MPVSSAFYIVYCVGRILPELRLPPRNPIDKHILRLPQREVDRSSLHIATIPIGINPRLAVAVEKRFPVAPDVEIGSTQPERCASLRVRHAHTGAFPIVHVGAPGELALDRDVAVLQVEIVHDFGDSEVTFGDFDLTILSTLLEGIHDGDRIVFTAAVWCYRTEASFLGHAGERRDGEEQRKLQGGIEEHGDLQ